jgi:putative membrane protein
MFGMFNTFDYIMGGVGIIMMFVPFVIGILIILLLIKLLQGKKINSSSDDLAIKILRERFAKGEIDEEEFNKKMELLKK